jgi:lysophospholipase L1-like esterase
MTILQKGAFVALGVAFLAACGSSNNSTPSSGSKPLFIAYTAIGASDAVGYGSTQPCTEASPALVADPTCPEPGAAGYVPDVRTDLGAAGFSASLQDLGISGAVIGPDIQAMGDMYASASGPTPCQPRTGADLIPGNFLQQELPKVNPAATLVTIFAGGNDTNAIVNALACLAGGGATAAQQQAFATTQITNFGHDFATLVGSVHAQAPSATIVVANIPNFANVPYAMELSTIPAEEAALRGALQEVSVAIDTNVINTVAADGIPVVDLQCDPQSYVPANFYTDGFHPNDAGYALLAQKFVQQALTDNPVAPESTCAEQAISTASSGARMPAVEPLFSLGSKPAFPAR